MTCIVSFFDKDRIILAGDKICVADDQKWLMKEPKVFFNNEFMVGYTSSFRMGQLLKYVWNPPKRGKDQSLEDYIYRTTIESIRKLFRNNGYGEKINEHETYGFYVLCYENHIYGINANLAACEYTEDIVCEGSGHLVGRVAVKLLKEYETDFKKILDKTFAIVAECLTAVSKEYDYITSDQIKSGTGLDIQSCTI